MADGFILGADLAGIGIAIVLAVFFAIDRGLLPDFALAFFFAAADFVGLERAEGFFWVPICMFAGIFGLVVSCPARCGCWARTGVIANRETSASANARRHA
jgi:hypothetical protein